MKVLFRMLASILPGVMVGLGVIAYLERDALREQWLAFSGQSHLLEEAHEHEAESALPPLTEVPIKGLSPQEEVAVAPVEETIEPSPAPEPVAIQLPAKPDLAAVIGLQPKVEQPIPFKAPEPVVMEPVAPAATAVVAPVVPAVKPVAEAPKLSQPTMTSAPVEVVEQPPVTEMAEVVTALPEQMVARAAAPIASLAEQFNPLSAGEALAKLPQQEIWKIGPEESEAESHLQWLWNRGRQAFWEGDYELAVESYRSLLEEDGRNPDAWGELGNIYYAKRDWVRAVRAFGRAAVALKEAGRQQEAEKIIQVIRSIDPTLAEKLMEDLG